MHGGHGYILTFPIALLGVVFMDVNGGKGFL